MTKYKLVFFAIDSRKQTKEMVIDRKPPYPLFRVFFSDCYTLFFEAIPRVRHTLSLVEPCDLVHVFCVSCVVIPIRVAVMETKKQQSHIAFFIY